MYTNCAILRVTNNPDTQLKMNEILTGLMEGVTRSLDAKNREHFGKKFADLRQALSSVNH